MVGVVHFPPAKTVTVTDFVDMLRLFARECRKNANRLSYRRQCKIRNYCSTHFNHAEVVLYIFFVGWNSSILVVKRINAMRTCLSAAAHLTIKRCRACVTMKTEFKTVPATGRSRNLRKGFPLVSFLSPPLSLSTLTPSSFTKEEESLKPAI